MTKSASRTPSHSVRRETAATGDNGNDEMLCPECGSMWGKDEIAPGMPYSEACWISLRVLTLMMDGYNGSRKEQNALKVVGGLMWEHLKYGLSCECKEYLEAHPLQ